MKQQNENAGPPHADQIESLKNRTYAVVITFQPDLEALERQFSALSGEGVKGLVVDNRSRTQTEVGDLAERYSLGFIALSENMGVAGAQNVGIDYVKQEGGAYLLLLDQDSVPEQGALERLIRGYLSLDDRETIGAIGSSYTLQSGHRGSSFVRFDWCRFTKIYCEDRPDELREVDFLISSGTFIPVAVLDRVGPMREELFIDHIDTEWFLRAKSHGYRFYGCCTARMSHGLGEHTYRVWFGRWRTVPIHRGFRYFFMFRNSLWLYKQEYAPSKWVSADVLRLIYIFLFSGVLGSSGWKNMGWMIKGLRAGLHDIDDPRSIATVEQIKATLSGEGRPGLG